MKKSFTLILILFFTGISAQYIIDINDSYKYYKGIGDPGFWQSDSYNDSEWLSGNAPFRYGDGSGGTVLNDMQNSYSSFYLRKQISIDSLGNIERFNFYINYDDGFAIWINGTKVVDYNAPANPSYNSFATALHESGTVELFQLDSVDCPLKKGLNTIAVQCYNYNLTSSDIYFDMSIEIVPRLPEVPHADKPMISHPGGFYDSPFDVTISTANSGDTIRYTLDCSNPETSATAIEVITPVSITIDPDNITNRPKTPAVVLRTCALGGVNAISYPISATYIFIDKVKTQTYPGGQWPSSPVNSQVFDYDMDADIVNSTTYSDYIDDALLQIPSISLVTDLANLVDPVQGIYVNAGLRSDNWERPGSVELIYPDGKEGFTVNTGIRIRGGWSRHPDNPKHAFRLFFRSEYGNAKLNYPLFGDEGTNTFDKIDLRTSQNYSWSYKGSPYNTMNRDVFSRDLQREMNQPYTRSSYYHLYLNGVYWGLYQSQERAEARFAESYFGGDKSEYDVIKVNTQNYSSRELEATDGNLDAWQELYNITVEGYDSNANYYKIQGLNSRGEIDTTLKVLVDIDNLIDYMLVIFYGGNFDSPYSKFGDFINNFFNIRNREFKRQGFMFFAHDAEHSMLAYPVGPGVGPTEDRVNISLNVTGINNSHAQWIHQRLTSNALYKMRFADRAYKYLYNNGLLTPAKCEALFRLRAEEINMAIIAESARWGDSKSSSPLTKANWSTAVNDVVNLFIKPRTDILIGQLKTAGLLPDLDAPIYLKGSSKIEDQSILYNEPFTLTITNTNGSGEIYYCTNNTDPRNTDGSISSNAFSGGDESTVNIKSTMVVKSRIKYGNTWSPLNTITILADDHLDDLKITEINYNPKDDASILGKQKEFLEFKNCSNTPLNISELQVDSAVYFKFPSNTVIEQGEFVVLVSDKDKFEYYYGMKPTGEYKGHLSNSGEQIILTDQFNRSPISFNYYVNSPWPYEPNLYGNSLAATSSHPDGDPGIHTYWKVSSYIDGSPFADDILLSIDDQTDFTNYNELIKLYPNPTSDRITIQLSDISQSIGSVQIINLNGMILKTYKNINKSAFELSFDELKISTGLYMVNIVTPSNSSLVKVIYY